ncbi:hypothetical protein D9756_005508 [Leucocoprinus leucothites]|uniref:Uncharacterized protein n=1 Tax=Leucocoprinus leucothites TaxID=201217 RepID=A0A8H5D707_9AGAR|nr:hypothetical protein D9756_005508 [Leucoagaricus leucothites]
MKNYRIIQILIVLLLVTLVVATDGHEYVSGEYTEDPYLKYRPPFVQSLPVQILLTGVVLTLTVVLLIHLLFTAQYHWPLAPVNYVLQISGVTTLLISLIATIHVVLSASRDESAHWPYMLSYIAVEVPPSDENISEGWSVAEKATWAVMTASTSGLVQITHIQFLTLLYPSRLEKQLIFALLGPLAIVAAVMQLIPINEETSNPISSDVKNVCNATLSLLFTVALFIWGLLVNRKQAWRTDGGTAVFGAAALILALVSTALNFIYVDRGEEEIAWLPGLMWAVVLWQSFLGWWWWVGAGSGSGLGGEDDEEEKLRKEAKREDRRREAEERRLETRKRAKRVWRDVAVVFGKDASVTGESSSAQPRPRPSSQISRVRTRSSPGDPSSSESPQSVTHNSSLASPSRSALSSSTSSSSGTSLGTLPRLLPDSIHRFYATVRQAHLIAAQKQAAERVQRIREMERNGVSEATRSTWGVSNLLWRTKARRDGSVGRNFDTDIEEDRGEGEYELDDRRNWRSRSRDHEEDIADQAASGDDTESGRPSGRGSLQRDDEEIEEDREPSVVASNDEHPSRTASPNLPEQSRTRRRSLWWWGPLERWRLQDSTSYS